MKVHDFVLVTEFLCQLEQDTHLQRAILKTFLCLGFGFFALTQSIQTACFEDENLLILLTTFDQLIIDCHGLSIDREIVKVSELEYLKCSC